MYDHTLSTGLRSGGARPTKRDSAAFFFRRYNPKGYRPLPWDVRTEYFVNFSDLSILSTPVRNPRIPPNGVVFWQLIRLIHTQMSLTHDEGIFIRGAVTVGQVARLWPTIWASSD